MRPFQGRDVDRSRSSGVIRRALPDAIKSVAFSDTKKAFPNGEAHHKVREGRSLIGEDRFPFGEAASLSLGRAFPL
jgi:hypothetical protein